MLWKQYLLALLPEMIHQLTPTQSTWLHDTLTNPCNNDPLRHLARPEVWTFFGCTRAHYTQRIQLYHVLEDELSGNRRKTTCAHCIKNFAGFRGLRKHILKRACYTFDPNRARTFLPINTDAMTMLHDGTLQTFLQDAQDRMTWTFHCSGLLLCRSNMSPCLAQTTNTTSTWATWSPRIGDAFVTCSYWHQDTASSLKDTVSVSALMLGRLEQKPQTNSKDTANWTSAFWDHRALHYNKSSSIEANQRMVGPAQMILKKERQKKSESTGSHLHAFSLNRWF